MDYQNEPVKPPDIDDVGKAWKISANKLVPDHYAECGGWLVYTGEFGHPLWCYYQIDVVHLRPIEGGRDARVFREGATHEMHFIALDPKNPIPDVDSWSQSAGLYPIDLVYQFTTRSDIQAADLLEAVVRHICEGRSPDQDYREYWKRVIDNSAEHLMFGCHPVNN